MVNNVNNNGDMNQHSASGSNKSNNRLYIAALMSVIFLVTATLLYPDLYLDSIFSVGSYNIRMLGILFFVTSPAIIVFAWKNRRELSPHHLDVVLLITLGFISIRGLLVAENAFEKGMIISYASYALILYFGVGLIGQRRSAIQKIYLALVVTGMIVSAYAFLEFVLGKNIIFADLLTGKLPHEEFRRSGSTMVNPVWLGLVLVQIAPFFLFFYSRTKTIPRKGFWFAAINVYALGLIVTFTKGAWLTALLLSIVVAIWIAYNKSESRKSVFALLLLSLIPLIVATLVIENTVKYGAFSERRKGGSYITRQYMWERAPRVFVDNPIIGVGIWQGAKRVYDEDDEGTEFNLQAPAAIDNIYISVLVEEGIVGTVLAGVLIVIIYREAWRLLRRRSLDYAWVLPVIVSISATLINGLTCDSLLIWPCIVVFWLNVGILRAQIEQMNK